jgi:hypothetical protein
MATTAFNDLITFSRGSNATVVGSNGLIQWAPNNLLTFSEQFDNAAWVKSASGQVTVTANQAVAPDGTRTADLVVPNASSGYHNIRQGPTTAALVYTQTVYYKPSGYTKVAIREDFAVGQYAAFDCVGSGTIINKTAAASASITALTDGWYQLTLTPTTTTANQGMGVYIMDAGYTSGDPPSYTFTGNGTSGGFLWGAQLEIGSTATTYNSTTVKNLLGFSEAFDNAAWSKANASIVTGAQANPVNGLFNAQKLMEDTANAGHFINQLVTTIAGTSYTASVYLKAAGRNARLFVYQSASPFTTIGSITVDLSNGSVLSGSGTVVNVGSGWYRVSVTGAAIDTATRVRVDLAQGATFTYTGDGNSGVYIYGALLSDSASLDPYVPTPGAAPSSTAFYGPRFDFDPVTRLPRGLLVEEQRTNLLLNSLITGANLSTQNVTVTAVAHTISFYGTGSITLSGAHSATVNGTGAYPTRTTLTFTPTAGTLTCTVSGTVQFANLEAGAFATSYIPTIASTVTRSADVATITGSLFSQWYNQPQGTFVVSGSFPQSNNAETLCVDDGSGANTLEIYRSSATKLNGFVRSGNVTVADMACSQTLSSGATYNTAIAYATDSFAFGIDGVAPTIDTAGAVPVAVNIMRIGLYRGNIQQVNGHIRNIRFIPARAADFQLQALST